MIKLFKYLKPYWKMILVASIVLIIQVISNLFVPNLLADMIRQINPTLGNSAIIEIVKRGSIALSVVLLVIACQIITTYLSSKIGMSFGRDVRNAVFEKTQKLTLAEFKSMSTASLINRTTNDINQVQQVVLMSFRTILNAPIILIGGCIMAFSLDLSLPFIIISIIPVLLALFVIVAKFIIPLFKQMQTSLDDLTVVTRENLTGVRVIRAFNTDNQENKRFETNNEKVRKINEKANVLIGINMPTVEFIFSIMILLIVYFGAVKGTSIADITALTQYGMRIMMGFVMMLMVFILIPRASASAKRINEILYLPNTIEEENKTTKKLNKETCKGELTFKNVSFTFPNANEPTLKNISFNVKPNETLAIVGTTGSGKSTIINLIPRYYDVTEGEILLDGENILNYNRKDLREIIGIASQKVEMFSGTIKENLKYGNEFATDKKIEKATKLSCCEEFILEKPEKYDYKIQKGASNLSGGQKQRLNIARALVKNPKIYIFDDSFSALDFKTDATIRKNIKQNVLDAVIIIVAQRINTIANADKILVLNDGNMVGYGTHKELLSNCKEYKELVDSQTKKYHIKGQKNENKE